MSLSVTFGVLLLPTGFSLTSEYKRRRTMAKSKTFTRNEKAIFPKILSLNNEISEKLHSDHLHKLSKAEKQKLKQYQYQHQRQQHLLDDIEKRCDRQKVLTKKYWDQQQRKIMRLQYYLEKKKADIFMEMWGKEASEQVNDSNGKDIEHDMNESTQKSTHSTKNGGYTNWVRYNRYSSVSLYDDRF